ncbi:MAG: hypothetical protein CTY16_05555 [Methylobacter sp.]|nr:MAG: hypothetical protein CTY16_05555 [Methylobacter sp.]
MPKPKILCADGGQTGFYRDRWRAGNGRAKRTDTKLSEMPYFIAAFHPEPALKDHRQFGYGARNGETGGAGAHGDSGAAQPYPRSA